MTVRLAKTPHDRQACLAIRDEVFIIEQQVAVEIERDADDAKALHFLALEDDVPVGTARVVVKPDGTAKIGRVAVIKSHRGHGIGQALMRAIEAAAELLDVPRFWLEAQTHALVFYQRLGYVAEGDEFMEAGIAHRTMVKVRHFN